MQLVGLDFETYYDNEYGLGKNKLTTEEYVRDKRFEPLGCAIKNPEDAHAFWYDKPEYMFQQIDWKDTCVVAHHAHFDGLILSRHYGIHPARFMCTLSMGRGVLGNHLKLALGSLASHFGLQPKTVPYDLFKGKHWYELTDEVQELVANGACDDVDITMQLLAYLLAGYTSPTTRPMPCYPPEELAVIDQTVRMFTQPRIVGDTAMLGKLWEREANDTAALLHELGVTVQDLRSDDKFAALLEAEGVVIQQKITPAGNVKPAFAKTDDFMRDLLEAPEPDPDTDEWTPGQDRVQLLAQARVKAKSNLELTRSERLGWMSTRGKMCVYINYCGAHTTRDSGGDKTNWQNFKRGSPLRRALCAPPGFVIGVVDASQIECRFLNAIAGEERVLQAFRDKRDLYCENATLFYERPITKDDKPERGTGKQLELSCGYGAGEYTIVVTAKKGTYGPPVQLTLGQGLRAKELYRSTHPNVVGLWADDSVLLKQMANFRNYDTGAPFEIQCDASMGTRRIVAPNGMHLIYDSLEWYMDEDGDRYWRIRTRRGYAKLYGSKVTENKIQFISRVHTFQVAVRVERETGLWPWLRNHDELGYLLPDDQNAEPTMQWIAQQLRTPPTWLPHIPLDAEYTIGERYEK